MKYYAIADIHGRYDLLNRALDKIAEVANPEEDKIITLGDYIDRGPDSNKVIQCLLNFQHFDGIEMICLQGNHEAMMVESITAPLHPDWWIGNGGDATLKSYGWGGEPYFQMSYEVVPKEHIDWLRDLPLWYETEKQIFVHAGIPQWGLNLPPKNERFFEEMQWMLYPEDKTGGWKGKHVVHGHHQHADGPRQYLSEKTGGRTNLDTWAYHTGRLVIGVFDDSQLHAKEFIEVK
jgi:serine/threonine protein phosphatase 1